MKKAIICFIVLTFGLSCTKDSPMIACGCSPVESPTFRLIIKDSNNTDFLDPSRSGSLNKDQIKITYKEADAIKNISFTIGQPFSFGENLQNKFQYYQLVSSALPALRFSNKAQEFYIDLGDEDVHSLTFDYNLPKGYPENVKIDGVAVGPEPSLPEVYGRIYYLLK